MHWSEIALVIIGVLLIIGCIGGIIYFYRFNNNQKKENEQFMGDTTATAPTVTTTPTGSTAEKDNSTIENC